MLRRISLQAFRLGRTAQHRKGDAMERSYTPHSARAASAAFALAAAALAAPLAAQGVESTPAARSPSSPSSLSSDPVLSHVSPGASARGGSAADQAMADRVATALAADPALQGATITVIVDGGQVNLDGTTTDQAQAAHATDVAQAAAGPAIMVVADDLQPTAIVIAPAAPPATR
jgi:osmotically-inducible protein OsmY